MRLDELRHICAASSPEDWNTVTCWGAYAGPSFLSQISETPLSEDVHEVSHPMRASYRPDISIGLAWCWLSNPEWHEDWIDHFDDKTASSHFVDFLYNGMLVDREVYIVVDGGRAYLPLPREMKITQWQYDFFRLLDSLEHASDFERYVKQAGFTVIE